MKKILALVWCASGLCGCSLVASTDDLTFDLDAAAGSDVDTDADADVDSDVDTDLDTDADTDAASDSTSEPGSETHSDGDSTSDSETASDPDSASDTAASCPSETHACVEEVVAGWNGPVIVYEGAAGATPPACDGAYPSIAFDAQIEPVVPASTCTCACGPVNGAGCFGSSVLEYHDLSSTCADTTPSVWSINQTCNGLGGAIYGGHYWRFDPSGLMVAGGSCQVEAVEEIPPVEPQGRLIVCGGASDAGGCGDDRLCLPRPLSPFAGELCLWKSGDVLCPSTSAFDQRSLRYTAWADTRDCVSCTCGAPSGSCAGSSITLLDTAGCPSNAGSVGELPGSGDCVLSASTPMTVSARFNAVVEASCAPSTGGLNGTVTDTAPATFCCLAP